MASLPRSACTDTSIASSCWANTRRGCHRAVPHYSSKGFETLNSIPLSPKRLLSCRKLGDTLVPLPLRILERIFELNRHIFWAIWYLKVVIIPSELSVENFCWSNFARQRILAVMIVWTDKNLSQTSFWKSRVRWRVRFLFDHNREFGFAPIYQQTALLIIEKGSFTWVWIKLIWLRIFWPPWLPQLAFHHRCLRPHRTRCWMTTERLRTPDELNEKKKGVAGSGKDECYSTMSVQLWCNKIWLAVVSIALTNN